MQEYLDAQAKAAFPSDIKLVLPDMLQSMTIKMVTDLQDSVKSLTWQVTSLSNQITEIDRDVQKLLARGK